MTERFANEMLDELQRKMLVRMEKLTCAIESLSIRIHTLEKGIQQFRGELPSKLAVDTSALMREITELAAHIEDHRRLGVDRDQAAVQRAGQQEFSIDQRADQFKSLGDEDFSEYMAVIDAMASGNHGEDDEFRNFIMDELSAIKDGVQLATAAREQTDDEIVNSINQYTTALQRGLQRVI